MAAKQEAKKLANSSLIVLSKELSKASDQQHYSCYYYIRVPIVEQVQYSEQRPAAPPYDVVVNNIPVVLSSTPGSSSSSKPRRLRKCISCKCYCFDLVLLVGILCLVAMGLILWLSQPKLDVVRVHLNHMNIISSGGAGDADDVVFLDASMDLEVRIQKYQDLIPYSYNLVTVFIGYQGVWHQPTMSNERFVDTRDGVSYLEATVGLNGTQQALATSHGHDHNYTTVEEGGFVPLDIVVQVGASYHFLYVYIPVEGKISCSVNVDMENQTIANQNCYPLHGIIMDPPMA